MKSKISVDIWICQVLVSQGYCPVFHVVRAYSTETKGWDCYSSHDFNSLSFDLMCCSRLPPVPVFVWLA